MTNEQLATIIITIRSRLRREISLLQTQIPVTKRINSQGNELTERPQLDGLEWLDADLLQMIQLLAPEPEGTD